MFTVTLVTTAILLLYSVPGYLVIRTKLIKPEAIPAFAKMLMYVCQPCLTVYAFQKARYTPALVVNILILFGLALLLTGSVMGIFYLIFRKKQDDVKYRVGIICACFGNVTFIGAPLVEALMPDCAEAVIYSTIFFVAMNILGWTVGSALITRDRHYCRPLNVVLNPAVLGLAAALPLFFFKITLPASLGGAVTLMGRMSTPMCMLVLGMRLATVPFKSIFSDALSYIEVFAKQIGMPLLALGLAKLLPLDPQLELCMYILACCPVAVVALNFAEMLGGGQKETANTVLLGTLGSIATLPLMLLLV
jgi:predicted permease